MLDVERSTPRKAQLETMLNGESPRFPRYIHPDSGITIVDVHKAINPERTRLIPIFDASTTKK